MSRARTILMLVLAAVLCFCTAGCRGQQARVRIGRNLWDVQIAADPQSRQVGLSGRKQLPEATGMLFIFPSERVLHFHMLNCLVPLDVAFISSTGCIVEIRTMAVEAEPSNPTCLYSSRFPARYALEVAGGTFEKAGVKVGDQVEFLGAAKDAVKGAG